MRAERSIEIAAWVVVIFACSQILMFPFGRDQGVFATIADTIATALSYEGFQVEVAADGRRALALIDDFRPDMVVLDVMLPSLDGLGLARQLRAGGTLTPIGEKI